MTLKATAEQVLVILEEGRYRFQNEEVRFGPAQESAVKNTRLYRPADFDELRLLTQDGQMPATSVMDGTTQAVAYEMAQEAASPLALLNFASARNPGGGFLNGAKAQEEDICRCSGLYPCLLTCMEYYEANREKTSLLYTDYAIYSPRVPFFKTRGTGELLQEPFFVSVITAPAPNSRPFLDAHPGQTGQLESTFIRRWENVLCIARDQGVRRLLLGAWGCGAFGGDPAMASATAKLAIKRFGSALDQIVFAIPSSGRQSKANLDAFAREFAQISDQRIVIRHKSLRQSQRKSVRKPTLVDGKEYFRFSQKELSIDEAKWLADCDIEGDRYGLVLWVQELSDEVAKALSHCKRLLFLPHLTSLSDSPGHIALARKLGTQGFWSIPEPLDLNGLTTISAAAAKEIAVYDADDLLLNGLIELTEEIARSLAVNEGPRLSLNGVLELSDNAAGWLAKYQGDEIHMRGLIRLNGSVGHVALAARLLSQGSSSYNCACLQEVSSEAMRAIVEATATDRAHGPDEPRKPSR